MAKGYDRYLDKSSMLTQAAGRVRRNVGASPEERETDLQDLLVLADAPPPAAAGIDAEAALGQALLDLQTANVLVTVDKALQDPAGRSELDQAVNDINDTRRELLDTTAFIKQHFELQRDKSAALPQARSSFESNASRLLDEIVKETLSALSKAADVLGQVVRRVLPEDQREQLDELAEKVFQNLGSKVPFVDGARSLLRKAIDLFNRALDTVLSLFGEDAIKTMKAKVKEQFHALVSGILPTAIVGALLGVSEVRKFITARLEQAQGEPLAIDQIRDDLDPVGASFTRRIKLIQGLIAAASAIAGALFTFGWGAPPVLYGFLVLLVVLVAGALIVGTDYTGARRVLAWDRGVRQVAEDLPA